MKAGVAPVVLLSTALLPAGTVVSVHFSVAAPPPLTQTSLVVPVWPGVGSATVANVSTAPCVAL